MKHFEFQTPVFLVGAGEFDSAQFLELYDDAFPVIAVDGGANHLYHAGVLPSIIIGDLDSVECLAKYDHRTTILQIADQNSTDLEKCIETISAPRYVGFGFTGKRFDHTMEIAHVFLKYAEKTIVFVSTHDVIFKIPHNWQCGLPSGTRVSLFPLKMTQILHAHGFVYDPSHLAMEMGFKIGTSNTTNDEHISLSYDEKGFLIGIVPVSHFTAVLASLT